MDGQGLKSNGVKVYVWLPFWDFLRRGGRFRNVGHVAIKFPPKTDPDYLLYLSYWPTGPRAEGQKGRPACNMGSYDNDKESEGRDADLAFYLYTLDVTKMQEAAKSIMASPDNLWHLQGDAKGEGFHSCASAANCVLQAGGFRLSFAEHSKASLAQSGEGSSHLTTGSSTSKSEMLKDGIEELKAALASAIVKSPDVLAKKLKSFKTKEWESYDEDERDKSWEKDEKNDGGLVEKRPKGWLPESFEWED